MCKKYIKYRAYGNLRNKLVEKIKNSGIKRPSKLTNISTLVQARAELEESIPKITIVVEDSLDTIVEKKRLIKENELYMSMIQEAFRDYNKALALLDRPTVSKISKELDTIMNTVIGELLEL